ncbi:regulator of microtubule dynamics protein 1-like [Anthonomus grandis grandis]|uniref:regulator of microtubule dynamics protein 1-like n=1 Tax=Anthonomus grandis grandis TaxID=2921223 RepID=UPI002165A6D3|nr:regulator of microtubule dynamics protein 1-like [Anthonomus grandis grandis]
MSLQQYLRVYEKSVSRYMSGAAVVGVIGVAGLLLMEYLRQEKHHEMSTRNVQSLERELSELRTELRELQEKKNKERLKRSNKHNSKKAHSIVSGSTDGYLSTSNLDSSDIEFYDCSDDEESAQVDGNTLLLETVLIEIDKKLDLGDIDDIENALEKLEDLCLEYPSNPELLYRIGKAHHKVAEESDNKEFIEQRLAKGIAACNSALAIDPEHGEVHKWYAVLIGSKSNKTVDIKEKINGGYTFKKHVDKAISIKPDDYSLHYMLGRFQYELAGLRWYERKVAAALYSEPPYATYEDAFSCFLTAERLAPFEWKENRLMMGKCKIAMSQYKEAVEWLEKADGSRATSLDKKVDMEIKELLRSYNSYK